MSLSKQQLKEIILEEYKKTLKEVSGGTVTDSATGANVGMEFSSDHNMPSSPSEEDDTEEPEEKKKIKETKFQATIIGKGGKEQTTNNPLEFANILMNGFYLIKSVKLRFATRHAKVKDIRNPRHLYQRKRTSPDSEEETVEEINAPHPFQQPGGVTFDFENSKQIKKLVRILLKVPE